MVPTGEPAPYRTTPNRNRYLNPSLLPIILFLTELRRQFDKSTGRKNETKYGDKHVSQNNMLHVLGDYLGRVRIPHSSSYGTGSEGAVV
ncbi:unnamed protein product [Tuber aestivum]|uniref:Uncharacterized protein n=1 Tax=Tuber aestivum TaxID=59557 RepID=A0A292PK94_9PEZI|nr:unnamed protein product [Tuber aestivum]